MDTSDRNKAGPAFIGVGPEKTGTSWLYRNLKAHPDLFLPPIKELKYFWERHARPGESIVTRFTGRNWHNRLYRKTLKNKIKHYLRQIIHLPRLRNDLAWDLRYLFRPHTDEWYASLFEKTRRRLGGDVSPKYFGLPEQRSGKSGSCTPT